MSVLFPRCGVPLTFVSAIYFRTVLSLLKEYILYWLNFMCLEKKRLVSICVSIHYTDHDTLEAV